jgi:tRNA threonylcarbamoyl adenosine modification protein YeaZ
VTLRYYPRPVPPQLVLVLDTATPAVVAALVALAADPAEPAVVLAARVTADGRRHGELLAPSVSAVLAEAGRRPGELTAVVTGVGPGPFTGLRVGLVTAAALADALRVPGYGVCSLDAIAAPVLRDVPLDGRRLLVATDARRREVYWAAYEPTGARVAGPDVHRPAELSSRLAELDVAAVCGAGGRLYPDLLPLPVVGRTDHPDPAALAALARDRVLVGAPAEPLTPLYLRRPDAAPPGRPKPVTAGAP